MNTGTASDTDPDFKASDNLQEESKGPQEGEKKDDTPSKKFFTRNNVLKFVPVGIQFPDLYPGFEPFEFKLRFKLSREAEEQRQQFAALSQADQSVKENEQNLDELCDLLTELPKGFGDLKDNGMGPGPSFKDYVANSGPAYKDMLMRISQGAMVVYWGKISPREFRRAVSTGD